MFQASVDNYCSHTRDNPNSRKRYRYSKEFHVDLQYFAQPTLQIGCMLALAVLPAENVGRGNQNAEAYGEQIRKNSDSHLFFLQYFAQMLNRLIQHPHAVLQESFCLIFLLATVELRPIHSARETRTALFLRHSSARLRETFALLRFPETLSGGSIACSV